jgi:hypothetical protein
MKLSSFLQEKSYRWALVMGALCLHQTALASFYPPGYVIQRTCQTQGFVEVCAVNHHWGSFPRLSVKYTGGLMANSWGHVSAYMKLNGRDSVYPMTNSNFTEHLYLNEPKPYLCHTVDSNLAEPLPRPPQGGGYGWCAYTRAPGGGGLVWEVHPMPAHEADLFFYARDEFGRSNAWDVEVAFVSTLTGEWDSLSGMNYRFRFEAP